MGSKKKTGVVWVIAIIIIIVIIAAAWYARRAKQAAVVKTPAAAATVATPASAPAIAHPITAVTPAHTASAPAPLPPLAHSDAAVTSALARLSGDTSFGKFANAHLVQRIVATVNALPQHELGDNILPLHAPAGDVVTTTTASGQLVMNASNDARYAPYMNWVKQADMAQLAAWYVADYPLFQQAYQQLGYPHGYFNDRLVQVIDHLLKAPEPTGPLALVKTDKGYAFADPQLEALSAGQKLMIRVGPTNETLLKNKLRAFRAAITGQHAPTKASGTP
ncbi:MAG TPA: DUF3014 domain-containing protein [Rhodanobacteraceae bacterium]